ncbi:hypothetical protein TWF281_000532 [Arthrobotrys megalospora]
MASPPFDITLVNNSSFTFTAIIQPQFLTPKNFPANSPASVGPYSSQIYSAQKNDNSIWFKLSAPYGTTNLMMWATNDGATWSAHGAWVVDLLSPGAPLVIPSDIHLISNVTGSGGHTITIQPGAAKRGVVRDDTGTPEALALVLRTRARQFRA